jgi:hypothetical protein
VERIGLNRCLWLLISSQAADRERKGPRGRAPPRARPARLPSHEPGGPPGAALGRRGDRRALPAALWLHAVPQRLVAHPGG